MIDDTRPAAIGCQHQLEIRHPSLCGARRNFGQHLSERRSPEFAERVKEMIVSILT
jgi:hypothetical protein